MRRFFIAAFLVPLLLVPLALARFAGSIEIPKDKAPMADTADTTSEQQTATVRVFNTRGELTEPIALPRLVLSDEEWKARLDEEQYRILRNAGTEAPFCGTLLDNKQEGVYSCAGCSLPLFSSEHKFDSGTGWPSYYAPIARENITEKVDRSHGMVRTEILCARCDGHLGHVFSDGPAPTGRRYCLNSESMVFTASDSLADLGEVAEAVFAGGCFWCVEAVFEELAGVRAVISGYTGGSGPATYKEVTTGTTGHAESVKIYYDPEAVSYEDLLRVHFATHNPTTLNRQGADVGTHYRSAIFYRDEQEKAIAEAFIADLTDQKVFKNPIVTTLEPLAEFYVAEEYHQDFVCNNPGNGYVRAVALPKVEKVREKFPEKLRGQSGSAATADR